MPGVSSVLWLLSLLTAFGCQVPTVLKLLFDTGVSSVSLLAVSGMSSVL